MSVRIERDEGAAEIQIDRLLQDRQAAAAPVGAGRIDRGAVGERERELDPAERRRRRRLDALHKAKDPGAPAAIEALLAWPNPDDDPRLRAAKERARGWKAESSQPAKAPAR